MEDAVPSATARRVAMRRAAHQLFDSPRVLDDPLALRILGPEAAAAIQADADGREATTFARVLRAFFAARSRFAEDELARSRGDGVRQYVVLGAGLDTFAYRNPFADVRVFEVDHPATQAWKRELLAKARIAIPESMTFVPVNFETQTGPDALRAAGLDFNAPTFFSWLGVTMYLERATVMDMFRFVADRPAGSGIAFDYAISASLLGPIARMVLNRFIERVAAIGEPWTTFFEPTVLERDLRALGFTDVDDVGPDRMNDRYFRERTDGAKVGALAHLMKAFV